MHNSNTKLLKQVNKTHLGKCTEKPLNYKSRHIDDEGLSDDMKTVNPIKVILRCRPETDSERLSHNAVSPNALRILSHDSVALLDKIYHLDGVSLAKDDPLPSFYSRFIRNMVSDAMAGEERTILVYGPTGTGKSYTVFQNGEGIAHLGLKQIFEHKNISIRTSCLEIHNEKVLDLLASNETISSSQGLKILHGHAIGALSFTATDSGSLLKQIAPAMQRRRVAPTKLNAQSSRSHCILNFEIKPSGGRLSFVDLAGSESIGRSGAVDENAKQAGNINHGLLVLRRVMESLSHKLSHIPFRDSKLTQLLQLSLTAKSKALSPSTLLILCTSPNPKEVHESVITLQYGTVARKIQLLPSHCIMNSPGLRNMPGKEFIEEKLREKDIKIHQLQLENHQLSSRLKAMKNSTINNHTNTFTYSVQNDLSNISTSFENETERYQLIHPHNPFPFSENGSTVETMKPIVTRNALLEDQTTVPFNLDDLHQKFLKFKRENVKSDLNSPKSNLSLQSTDTFESCDFENWLFDDACCMYDCNRKEFELNDLNLGELDNCMLGAKDSCDEDYVDSWMSLQKVECMEG